MHDQKLINRETKSYWYSLLEYHLHVIPIPSVSVWWHHWAPVKLLHDRRMRVMVTSMSSRVGALFRADKTIRFILLPMSIRSQILLLVEWNIDIREWSVRCHHWTDTSAWLGCVRPMERRSILCLCIFVSLHDSSCQKGRFSSSSGSVFLIQVISSSKTEVIPLTFSSLTLKQNTQSYLS